MYKKVLIADDKEYEIRSLKELFEEKNIEVVFAQNPLEAYEEIEKKDIDLLILDWYFVEPSSNKLALQVVEALIDNNYYIPVFVYSNNIHDIDLQINFHNDYPKVLLNSMCKPNPSDAESVKLRIDRWFKKNPNVGLAKKWYEGVKLALGKTLHDIYNIAGGGVINLLKETYSSENADSVKDITNLIMTVFQDNLLQNDDFLKEVTSIINGSSYNDTNNTYENYKELRNFEMYSNIKSETSISTGDIFLINNDLLFENSECLNCFIKKDSPVYAVAITGECDYAKSTQKLRYHKLLLGSSLSNLCEKIEYDSLCGNINNYISNLVNYNEDSTHILPFISDGDKLIEIVLDFQNVITIRKDQFDEDLKKMRICRLRPTYYQHLLRRYSSYSSRIGVPEIPKQNRKYMAESIIELLKPKDIDAHNEVAQHK